MRANFDQRLLTEWGCTNCGVVLPAEKYKLRGRKNAAGSAPRNTICNRCLYVKVTRPLAQKKTDAVREYKLRLGCADCGYNKHPAALEFDHRPGESKCFNIGEKMSVYTAEKTLAEIAKCDVVCANCHAIRTDDRRTHVGIPNE